MLISDITQVSSPIHRTHPGIKFGWLLVLAVSFRLMNHLIDVIIVSVAVWGVVLVAARIPVKYIWQHRFLLFLVPSGLLIFHSLSWPGHSVVSFGLFSVSEGGLIRGLSFFFHFSTVIVASLLFVWTTQPRYVLGALLQAHVPLQLAFLVYLGLRFIPLMASDLENIRIAQRLRSGNIHGIKERVERWKRFLASGILNALIRADQVAMSMDIRGFGKNRSRSSVSIPTWSWGQTLLPITFLLLVIFLCSFRNLIVPLIGVTDLS